MASERKEAAVGTAPVAKLRYFSMCRERATADSLTCRDLLMLRLEENPADQECVGDSIFHIICGSRAISRTLYVVVRER